MNIDDLIPTDGSVLILSARMVNGKLLWAKTEASVELWNRADNEAFAQLILDDLREAERIAMERDKR